MRRTPLVARTPLGRGKPLGRHARLETHSTLHRGGPLRQVSTKRARENRQRAAVIDQLWPGRIVQCWREGCPRLADDVHEIRTRARGGSITDPANLAPLCRACHDETTNEAPWAYSQGLLVHSWPDVPDTLEAA